MRVSPDFSLSCPQSTLISWVFPFPDGLFLYNGDYES